MVIGVDIGGTHMRTALVDDGGKIVQLRKILTDSHTGARQTARRLTDECLLLMEHAKDSGGRVAAVGLGVAGKIDRLQGSVIFSPNLPSLNDYPLASELQADLGVPVVMENDANAFGIGENWIGAGRGIRNWIGVTLGTGVGGCLILDGELWQGDDLGFVGEIGHTNVHPEGPVCACGLRGCLESHSSGRALVEGVAQAVSRGELLEGALYEQWKAGGMRAAAVHIHASAGDPIAQSLFERMGWALGIALAGVFTVLGIRHAIIGGGVSAGWDQFIGPLMRALAEHSSMLDPGRARVLRTALGDTAALLGAALLASGHAETGVNRRSGT